MATLRDDNFDQYMVESMKDPAQAAQTRKKANP